MLFVVSQWPKIRTFHLRSLTVARAIENQMFVVCCNSCGTAGETVYGGSSAIIDPWGETLALAGEKEELLSADCDLQTLQNIRGSIPVFRDRRPELYSI
jgi:predicted amidohydrolase